MQGMTGPAQTAPSTVTLPHSFFEAALRGIRGHCPRCGKAPLFRKWLKPVDRCSACSQDWSSQRADDFPAYVSIFVTGHVMAPILIWMLLDLGLSAWVVAGAGLPVSFVMAVAIIHPAKGVTIALMWWMGMSGFRKERPAGHPDLSDAP